MASHGAVQQAQVYTDSQVGTTNTTVVANTAAITVLNSGVDAKLTGQYQKAYINFFPVADNTDQAVFTITVVNSTCGGAIRLYTCGTLGDGDSTSTKEYYIAIARIAGAATGATIGAAVGTATQNGLTANATVTASLGAASGGIGATQTIAINVKCARSAGTATNHRISSFVEVLSDNGSCITVA
jgi:hypothetical protein